MQLIILLMTLSIAMIAFAPTYAAIGVGAPLLIVIARMLQGFATGGEYASATAFLVERAAPARSLRFLAMFGQCLAVFAGAGMGALVTHCLDAESLESWGWRVPFLFGLLIGPVGLWIRRYMGETEAFLEAIREPGERQGLLGVLREYRRSVLVSMGLTVIGTVSFYVVLVNMPTFAHKQLGLPLDEVFMVQMAAVALMTLVIPLAGDSPTARAAPGAVGRDPGLHAHGLSAVRLGRRGAEPGAPAADATVAVRRSAASSARRRPRWPSSFRCGCVPPAWRWRITWR